MTYWNLLWWLLERWQAIKRVAELFCSSWIPADIKEVIELIGYRTRFGGCLEWVVRWVAVLGCFFFNAANADKPAVFQRCLNVSHTRLMVKKNPLQRFWPLTSSMWTKVLARLSSFNQCFLGFSSWLCPSQLFSVTSERFLGDLPKPQ